MAQTVGRRRAGTGRLRPHARLAPQPAGRPAGPPLDLVEKISTHCPTTGRTVGRMTGQAEVSSVAMDYPPPRYVQLVRTLQERIDSGQYAPGDLMPSEHQLLREFGVSRATVIRALQILRN